MLDSVPSTKIFGHGCDCRYLELSQAHAKIAGRNVAKVLAERVSEGSCAEEVLELGRKLLHDNPDALFRKSRG